MNVKAIARAGTATAFLVAAIGLVALPAGRAGAVNPPDRSLRAQYHLTPPAHWLSDPQRPVYVNGKYNLYYLYSNPNNSPGGWRHATTTDNVVFTDQGIAIPLGGTNFPVWTGSGVVDTSNTAGFGAGAIIVLATHPTNGNDYQQEQYLWYSTDGGNTFTAYGSPVITNPGNSNWFRDPKIVWDGANSDWSRPRSGVNKTTGVGSPSRPTSHRRKDLHPCRHEYRLLTVSAATSMICSPGTGRCRRSWRRWPASARSCCCRLLSRPRSPGSWCGTFTLAPRRPVPA